ncbi:uncharacterized protein LOC119655151 [Hermetia illucens]|uniref:uncharacterized protein LOC119655151 n=1 Tax=Hermetia illucens TaxID=343691 RepID=UPI0018CC754D|nr:uncharacterized protein LOC119655151 [Hermetia illucens]
MSEPTAPPITSPPRRCQDHPCLPPGFILPQSSESCKNTPNIGRKLEHSLHHNLFKSGSHSAHNSPLPHRRLDKLEGVIRDKPSPLTGRRHIDSDDCSSSIEPSPIFPRKCNTTSLGCSCPHGNHIDQNSPNCSRRHTDGSNTLKSPENVADSPRRRVESDCSCMRKSHPGRSNFKAGRPECHCSATPKAKRKDLFSSPAKSVLGEPGVFSSPIHRPTEHSSYAGFGSPAKSVIGEPGVFASPVRSICASPSPCEDKLAVTDDDVAEQPQPDQTVVSGWLKFRDNKRWKIRWGVVTKLSPAAGK